MNEMPSCLLYDSSSDAGGMDIAGGRGGDSCDGPITFASAQTYAQLESSHVLVPCMTFGRVGVNFSDSAAPRCGSQIERAPAPCLRPSDAQMGEGS